MGIWQTSKTLVSLWAQDKKRSLQRGEPNTKVDSGGTVNNTHFDGQELDRGDLRDIKEMRESGGLVSQLVHAKALMQFGTGATFQAENDEAADWLHEQFNDLDNLLIDIGEDAIWFPYGLAEIVETQGGEFSHVEPIEPYTMLPMTNEYGSVVVWEQQISGDFGTNTQNFDPDEIAQFILNKSSARDKTGISTVLRAEDEISTYRENSKAIANAIDFAAFQRRHVKVGRDDGAVIDDDELRRVRNRVDNLQEDTTVVTGPHVEFDTIDPASEFKFSEITQHDIRKLAVALGVPIELASVISEGLGSGEQSGVRQLYFELERAAQQRSLGGQFVEQVARPLLKNYSPYDHEQNLDLVFGEAKTTQELRQMIDAIGEDMTVDERREVFDRAPLDDKDIGQDYPTAAKQEDGGEPDNPLFGSGKRLEDFGPDGFQGQTFEIRTDSSSEDNNYTDDLLAIGVNFPNSGVYVDWNVDAWPENQQLQGPHVSDYDTLEDLKQVTEGQVIFPEDRDMSEIRILATDDDYSTAASQEGDEPQGDNSLFSSNSNENRIQFSKSNSNDSNSSQTRELETYNDYPEVAQENARMALDAREETDNPNDCGTRVGWERANQLDNGEALSVDTISRMAAFERHEDNKEQGEEGKADCGWMMWKAWGGDEGIEWAQNKLDEIEAGGTGNKHLSNDTPEWDAHYLELFDRIWNSDSGRNLFQFDDYEVPEFAKNRLRDAVLSGSVFSDIESIPSDQRGQLKNFLIEELEDDRWNIDGIADRLQDLDADIPQNQAETIARTELASTVNKAREIGYEEREDDDSLFYWTGVLNDRTTDACEWLIRQTNPKHGGKPVAMNELKELIDEAPEHDDDMQDDLARPDDWVVHPNERKTWVRHVE